MIPIELVFEKYLRLAKHPIIMDPSILFNPLAMNLLTRLHNPLVGSCGPFDNKLFISSTLKRCVLNIPDHEQSAIEISRAFNFPIDHVVTAGNLLAKSINDYFIDVTDSESISTIFQHHGEDTRAYYINKCKSIRHLTEALLSEHFSNTKYAEGIKAKVYAEQAAISIFYSLETETPIIASGESDPAFWKYLKAQWKIADLCGTGLRGEQGKREMEELIEDKRHWLKVKGIWDICLDIGSIYFILIYAPAIPLLAGSYTAVKGSLRGILIDP
jgi:hypothetical protein